MSLTLHVDAARWRAHLAHTVEEFAGIVPVVKGNGYGFGRNLAAAEAERLGLDTLAVGTYAEAEQALDSWPGDVLVLSAWRPWNTLDDSRLIHTVGRVEDVRAIGRGSRVLLESRTSLGRHGLGEEELGAALSAAHGLKIEGLTIHLPLAGHHDNVREAKAAAGQLIGGPISTLWVSHLNAGELTELRRANEGLTIRPRVGTALWLGELDALQPAARVLDVHRVRRGERVGYRQRQIARAGHVLVIGAGTSHGIGLDAPKANKSVADRGKSLARGTLEAAGWSRSPFVVGDRQRWFVEPPHMHHSLVLLPDGITPPAVGDEVTARLRFTTTAFDAVVFGLPPR
jgi:alanine racemase